MKRLILSLLVMMAATVSAQTPVVSNQYQHIKNSWTQPSYTSCNFTVTPSINTSCIEGYQFTFTPPTNTAVAATVPSCSVTVTTNCVGALPSGTTTGSYIWGPGGYLYSGTWTISITTYYLDNNGTEQTLPAVTTSSVVPPPFVAPNPVTNQTATPQP